jgi:hypothetical protein
VAIRLIAGREPVIMIRSISDSITRCFAGGKKNLRKGKLRFGLDRGGEIKYG